MTRLKGWNTSSSLRPPGASSLRGLCDVPWWPLSPVVVKRQNGDIWKLGGKYLYIFIYSHGILWNRNIYEFHWIIPKLEIIYWETMEIWTVFYDDSMIIWLGQKWGSYPQDHQNKKKELFMSIIKPTKSILVIIYLGYSMLYRWWFCIYCAKEPLVLLSIFWIQIPWNICATLCCDSEMTFWDDDVRLQESN